ncbi:amino acid permease [Microcoleus sp. FACHB-831]|uniref:ATP-binding protein n=1 Tax=Microcoleus sp. FACHB-831 TaxID=2692827 RepID=UPI001689CA3E|nr:ATP-binding protein [Microcoleus sp. FACHB-831]MBD1919589.1 amino acid permease [Microcoleus sp. FACHB-831]
MLDQPVVGVDKNQHSTMRLPRSLSAFETWGFGLTAHTGWIAVAPAIHAALGVNAIFVWLPGTIVGMLLNFQVQRLGMRWPEMSGGTPNYAARLLKHYPGLARYVALGYFVGWASAPAVIATVLSDLIKANLEPLGIACPTLALNIGFTCIAFVVAFSGTRALAILHLFFLIPAVGFLLTFCFQGLWWLTFSHHSPGFFPPVETSHTTSLHFGDWAKWYFIGTWNLYGCETTSSFVADSRRPNETLRFMTFATWLMPPVYLGFSWLLTRLATEPGLSNSTYITLLAASKPFWGQAGSMLVTLLIAFSSFLNCATAVCVLPRILYQLSLDGHLSPVFAVVSKRGVLGPALLFTFLISLACLVWGDVARIVMVTNTGYLASIIGIHLGLWLRRGLAEVRWPWLSLGFCIVGAVVFVVGGLAWSWQDWLIGLLLPIVILAIDAAIRRIPFAPFHPRWWQKHYNPQNNGKFKDFVAVQVIVLIVLVCSATSIGWTIGANLGRITGVPSADLLVVLLVTIAFCAVAIACWTTLPQVASIAEAREHAETLFMTALDTVPDTILVLDQSGAIRQANPAAVELFEMKPVELIGRRLNEFLCELPVSPAEWELRSEQTLAQRKKGLRTIEATISQRSNQKLQEYIVILRDITSRKQSEEALQQSESQLREQALTLEGTLQDLQRTQTQLIQTEKMSSLGQLVAGVAHEINNPVNFIYGNITHVGEYTNDLLGLVNLYQQRCPQTDVEIEEFIEDIDLDFLIQDLPKTLSSMKVGAERIREIVLTLRNFSRLDESDMKPVNIHEGIDSSLLILHNRLKAKPDRPGIEIVKEYGNLPKVECYAGQLNQVFINIISNAIDALEKHDKERSLEAIKERPSMITIRTFRSDRDRVIISIQDNGPGMTDSVKSRVFDPFFTTKPVGQGTGLGLSISYQIVVDKHSGQLKCISTSGQGTEFLIEIPIRQ